MDENTHIDSIEAGAQPPRPAPKLNQRSVHRKQGHIPKLIPDRRRHRRVRLRLLGRFMRADEREYPCQVINISAGGIALKAPVAGEIGERVVCYIDEIGRIEGEIVRTFAEGFAVRIHATAHKREKLASQLTWLINRDKLNLANLRAHDRYPPNKPHTTITYSDGTSTPCRVLDISLSGASVAVDPRPVRGQEVTLGRMRGRVVRHHEQGVGIQFVDIQDPAALQRQFG